MSEFHDTKGTHNDMEPIHGHTDNNRDRDAGQIADDILDWLGTKDAASFDQSDEEALERMLAQLEAADTSAEEIDVEASRNAFHEKYAPLFENTDVKKAESPSVISPFQKKRSRSVFRRVVSIAAAIGILIGTVATAQAFGLDLFGLIARWTSERFRMESEEIPHAVVTQNPLHEGEEKSFDSLEAAIDAFGVSASLAPKQIPERFALSGVTAVNKSSGILIYADYESADGFFQIRFKESPSFNPSSLENENITIRLYSCGGIDHYLLTDQGCQKAFWQNGGFECRMFGSVSEEEMEEVIESIYN